MVNLTIDGKSVQVPEGTTVLRAAESTGIFIPTLCDHKELAPYGGCRLCLVEVEGFRTLQPSCTLPAAPNMMVKTDTEKIKAARKFVLTLIFSERNHFCPYCQVSGGDCELQNAAYREEMTHWSLSPNYKPFGVDASHSNIIIENNRCILCRRCVRACAELVGNFTLGIEERAASSNLIADLGTPLGESTCISCGTCAQVCPTGAIIDRASAYRGKEIQLNRTSTVCVGCSVGCGIEVLTRDNNLVRIEGNWQAPVNEGVLCKLGRYDPVEETRTRIHTPLVRRDGVLKAATWEEALDAASSRIKPFFGNKEGGVAALVSPRLPAESIALFQELFAEKIGSDMVTSLDEGAFTSLSATLADELGKSFEGTLDALKSSDCVVVFGADLVEDHQVVGFLVKRALPSGVKLILVTLDENPLEEQADVTIKPGNSADAKTLTGITAAIIKAGMAKNIAELKKEVSEETALKLGISMDDLVKAAQLLANSSSPVVILGKRIDPSTKDTLKKLIDFCDLFGAKIINLKGHANSVVASQLHLDQPFQLNGHKIAYLALGDEDPSQLMLQKLEKIPCLIVQSSFHNQATALADVVFPTTTWLEQEGHYINMDGRLQHAPRSLKPAEEIWTSKAILTALAGRMGVKLSSDWQNKLSARTPSATIREEKLTGNLRRYQWQSQK